MAGGLAGLSPLMPSAKRPPSGVDKSCLCVFHTHTLAVHKGTLPFFSCINVDWKMTVGLLVIGIIILCWCKELSLSSMDLLKYPWWRMLQFYLAGIKPGPQCWSIHKELSLYSGHDNYLMKLIIWLCYHLNCWLWQTIPKMWWIWLSTIYIVTDISKKWREMKCIIFISWLK